MDRELRALAALPQCLTSVPSTHTGGSQQSIILVPEYPLPSSGLRGYHMHHMCMVHAHTCRQSTHMHFKIK